MPSAPRRVRPTTRTNVERSAKTREKIMASAIRTLQRHGFQRTTLQEIARGARVTLGAVQHQFGSRAALFQSLADEAMQPLADNGAVWPPDAEKLPLAERADQFVTRAWGQMYGTAGYRAAWSLFFGAKSSDPALFRRIDASRMRVDPLFFARFLEAFPEICEHAPAPDAFARFVFASLRGIALLNIFELEEAELREELDALTHAIVLAGTGTKTTG